jgi:hypothetical protein
MFGGSESFDFSMTPGCIKDLLPSSRGFVGRPQLDIGGGTLSADATLKLNATRSPDFMERFAYGIIKHQRWQRRIAVSLSFGEVRTKRHRNFPDKYSAIKFGRLLRKRASIVFYE